MWRRPVDSLCPLCPLNGDYSARSLQDRPARLPGIRRDRTGVPGGRTVDPDVTGQQLDSWGHPERDPDHRQCHGRGGGRKHVHRTHQAGSPRRPESGGGSSAATTTPNRSSSGSPRWAARSSWGRRRSSTASRCGRTWCASGSVKSRRAAASRRWSATPAAALRFGAAVAESGADLFFVQATVVSTDNTGPEGRQTLDLAAPLPRQPGGAGGDRQLRHLRGHPATDAGRSRRRDGGHRAGCRLHFPWCPRSGHPPGHRRGRLCRRPG